MQEQHQDDMAQTLRRIGGVASIVIFNTYFDILSLIFQCSTVSDTDLIFEFQNAIIGIDDDEESTFTITTHDQKTFHFQGNIESHINITNVVKSSYESGII